jgi:hypothetical protein
MLLSFEHTKKICINNRQKDFFVFHTKTNLASQGLYEDTFEHVEQVSQGFSMKHFVKKYLHSFWIFTQLYTHFYFCYLI